MNRWSENAILHRCFSQNKWSHFVLSFSNFTMHQQQAPHIVRICWFERHITRGYIYLSSPRKYNIRCTNLYIYIGQLIDTVWNEKRIECLQFQNCLHISQWFIGKMETVCICRCWPPWYSSAGDRESEHELYEMFGAFRSRQYIYICSARGFLWIWVSAIQLPKIVFQINFERILCMLRKSSRRFVTGNTTKEQQRLSSNAFCLWYRFGVYWARVTDTKPSFNSNISLQRTFSVPENSMKKKKPKCVCVFFLATFCAGLHAVQIACHRISHIHISEPANRIASVQIAVRKVRCVFIGAHSCKRT